MFRLEYEGKYFKILNELNILKSSREVTFSDIVIDFTGHTIEDLPINFEEIRVWENSQKIFTGYLNGFELPSMKNQKQYIELKLNLLSPLQMASNRFVTAIGTFKLNELIEKIFEPLITDGFKIEELNVPKSQKTVSFLLESVEYVMNSLSHSESLWWYIDENKKIYVNTIDYQFGLKPVLEISNNKKIEGFLSVLPQVEATNYANIINVKNARVYIDSKYQPVYGNSQKPLTKAVKLKKGDTIDFLYPIDVSESTLERYLEKNRDHLNSNLSSAEAFKIWVENSNNVNYSAGIGIQDGKYYISDNIGFDDEDKIFVLKKDNFFKNLITGVQYKGSEDVDLKVLNSSTALEYRRLKLINSQEINANKGKISSSGVIEKTIDVNEKWFFENELIDETRNRMSINSSQANEVTLEFDIDKNLKIGDIVDINLPNFFTIGKFIITDIDYKFNKVKTWKIGLRNSSVLDNYIDLFREKESQEDDQKDFNVTIGEYIEDSMNEKYEVIQNG